MFVDVGNKSFGLEALMQYLGFQPSGVLHVGDRYGFPAGPHHPLGGLTNLTFSFLLPHVFWGYWP